MYFGLLVPNLKIKVAGCSDILLPTTKLNDVIRGHRYDNLKSQTFLCLFLEISLEKLKFGVGVYLHAHISHVVLILVHIVQT
jgi:hypothetical protein